MSDHLRDDRRELFGYLESAEYVDGDTTIAELEATSQTSEGASFDNRYCWVCRFEDEQIVEVRAYLESMMVAYSVLRNEPGPGSE